MNIQNLQFSKTFYAFLITFCAIFTLSAQSYSTSGTVKGRVKVAFDEAVQKLKSGDKDGALRLLDEALSTDPKFIDAHLVRGQSLRSLGRLTAHEMCINEFRVGTEGFVEQSECAVFVS